MVDVFSKVKRSLVMAAIKGRGSRSTELALKRILKLNAVRGWRSNPQNVPGRPDFVFQRGKLAIFTDGCFWHGCKRCGYRKRISAYRKFWREKIGANTLRDIRVSRTLRKSGWSVLRIWEHDIKHRPDKCLQMIVNRIVSTAGQR